MIKNLKAKNEGTSGSLAIRSSRQPVSFNMGAATLTRSERKMRSPNLLVGIFVAMVLLLPGACADSGPTGSSSGLPRDLMPDSISCANTDATDVGAEPAYSAGYLHRWQTYDGCSVRLDFVMTRRGGCFEGVDDILIGWPFGTTHRHHDYRIYLRDPQDATGARGDLELDTSLPPEAMDTGLRQEDSELGMITGDDEFIWLVDTDSVERWPQGSVVCA